MGVLCEGFNLAAVTTGNLNGTVNPRPPGPRDLDIFSIVFDMVALQGRVVLFYGRHRRFYRQAREPLPMLLYIPPSGLLKTLGLVKSFPRIGMETL